MLKSLGTFLWGWPMMLAYLSIGLMFTVRLRGIQLRKLGTAMGNVFAREQGSGLSPYATLCTALAATIGTGNIVGVATAMQLGGPGALFWMFLSAMLGMATQYAEAFLAVRFRKSTLGGPYDYMERLGRFGRILALGFASVTALAGLLGIGTIAQMNSMTAAAQRFFDPSVSHVAFTVAGRSIGWATAICAVVMTGLAALVLLGGADRITQVCQWLVPLMSVMYVCLSLWIILRHAHRLPSAVQLMLTSAFCPKAVLGAASGITLRQVMRMGIGRGVLTNEAGLGTTPMAAAASACKDPKRQGLVSMTGTFIDTIVVCTLTGLALLVTGTWKLELEGYAITDQAWINGLPWQGSLSSFLLMVCLIFFAFATVIGWSFYAERCLTYLFGIRKPWLYRICYIAALLVGPMLPVESVWELADILNACMGIPNLIALFLLRNEIYE